MSKAIVHIATASQTVGPFFHFALTREPIGRLVEHFANGEPIQLVICATDADGQPVTDAMVELRQAGVFGRMPTGEDGCCEFHTVKPGTEPGGQLARHAPYISVCVFARGLLRALHTRIYLAGDPALGEDPVLQLVPEGRRGTLLARLEEGSPDRWRFELRLRGEQETVFFNA